MNRVHVCCGEFIRIILFVLNFIFWAAGGVVLGIGVYVKVNVNRLNVDVSNQTLQDGAMMLIVLGCVVFVVGLLGCCGSLTQNRCMLLLYFTLVTLIFLGEIALAIAVYIRKDGVAKSFKEGYEDCMQSYGNSSDTDHKLCVETIDTFQSTLKCCGMDNATDWKNVTEYGVSPPATCCKDEKNCDYTTAYSEGCFTKISDFVSDNAKVIGIAVLAIAVIELVGMSLACYLRSHIIKRTEYLEPHAT